MINYVKKGQLGIYFIQVWDNNKPKIKCYDSLGDFMRVPESKEEVGFGKISITADNIVHLWDGNINQEHLRKYKESRKSNLLKILTH